MSDKEKVALMKVASLKGYRPQKLNPRHFKCPLCDYSSVFRSAVTGHLPTHCDERPYICNICSYSTKRSSDLQKHKHTKHFDVLKPSERSTNGGKSSGLVLCDGDQLLHLADNDALKLSGSVSVAPFAFGDVLGENMGGIQSGSFHRPADGINTYSDMHGTTSQTVSHRGKRGGANAGRSWNCSYCPIVFLDKALYLMHMGLHGVPNPWKCNLCSGAYNDVYGFTSHIINGHEAR